eukprot:TRINITY_DN2033_c0_g3_i4.p1 TRINITY_DN2033_c0_g3~~TRINITY_DN2033_c0_g3_i4.p1  ORF type:complete len:994 (+),score=370.66 TRINITY_DN2033_c0_g3_i4:120-2984(+)
MGVSKRKSGKKEADTSRSPDDGQNRVESSSGPPAKARGGRGADDDEEPEVQGCDNQALRLARSALRLIIGGTQLVCLLYFLWRAYSIRLNAVKTYGRVIHEFDPWFNFRATQYLADNGWYKFFHWYDYMSWYPLGRPVGTTIYPGMQIIAVWIWEALKFLPELTFRLKKRQPLPIELLGNVTVPAEFRGKWEFGPMNLNDVCVFVPAWFGALGSLFLGLLTREATGSWTAGVAAAGVMAIIPAHFSRGIAGGFDNESVAITALCMTFWLWCRALRTPRSWPIGALAGLAYIYMAAAWGGYIFVVNMVAAHAALLGVLGRYNSSLYRAYTAFFVVGTLGAMQVPVIGWQPLKSMEQILALLVFIIFQYLEFCDVYRRRVESRSKKPMSTTKYLIFSLTVGATMAAIAAIGVQVLFNTGYFSPLGARIRGLFIQHKKTGNPLVDSVAEHQAANSDAFYYYHHNACYLAPVGFLLCCLWRRTPGKLFLVLYAIVAYYFSLKMSRLIIICGPIASALSGVTIGSFLDFGLESVVGVFDYRAPQRKPKETYTGIVAGIWGSIWWLLGRPAALLRPVTRPLGRVARHPVLRVLRAALGLGLLALAGFGHYRGPHLQWATWARTSLVPPFMDTITVPSHVKLPFTKWLGKKVNVPVLGSTKVPREIEIPFSGKYKIGGRNAPSVRASDRFWPKHALDDFVAHAEMMAEQMSHPQIMFKTRDGQIIDDYREAYLWVKRNTPEDARVMAWWDYGYQITGIANRTTIADGNTWNHEHIATLGKCLTSPEDKAHAMVRHLADYVLIWAGGRGDDLAKSIHMARIGTSIYSDICPGDPTCSRFGFDQTGAPTPMMAKSLLYKLNTHGQRGVVANRKKWKDVYQSKNGLVRIFQVLDVDQSSKDWVANPANRVCDAPGSWYCVGQYPPKLLKHMKNRKDFAQLEDFNRKHTEQNAYSKVVLEKEHDV